MQANGKRKLRDRSVWDDCFEKPLYRDLVVKKDVGAEDTVSYIRKVIESKNHQTRKLAKRLKSATLEDTCRNIWEFCYYYIQYELDTPGVEEVETPNRIWANGETDCDGYATLIGCILTNLQIPFKIRVTAYKGSWQHVYITVPIDGKLKGKLDQDRNRKSYIVIDPVTDYYNFEVRYSKNFDTAMDLRALDGLADVPVTYPVNIVRTHTDQMTGLVYGFDENGEMYLQSKDVASLEGLWKAITGKKFRDTKVGGGVAETFDKVGQAVKDVGKWSGEKLAKGFKFFNRYLNPATILLRNGWLLAMKINLFKVAETLRWGYVPYSEAKTKTKLTEAEHARLVGHVKDIENIYEGFGGVKANLKKVVLNGKGNRDKLIGNDTSEVQAANDQSELDALQTDPATLPDGDNGLSGMEEDPLVAAYNKALGGLGEPITGSAALAAVSAAVLALKDKIAPLFNAIKGTVTSVKTISADVQAILPKTIAPQGAAIVQIQPQGLQPTSQQLPAYALPMVTTPATADVRVQTTNPDANKPEEKKFYESPAFLAVAALGAAGIGTAVYLGSKKGGLSGTESNSELSGITRKKKRKSVARKLVETSKRRDSARSKKAGKFSLAGITKADF